MAFGRKDDNEKNVKEAKTQKSSSKKNSGLSSILHESVPETVLDKFKMNEGFIRYENGDPKYVGIVLNTADIGGLDKKSRKDEAKGSIIECINSGRIQTYVTEDLLDAEMICIIPDAITLLAMDEFDLLTSAPYEFCQVDDNGDIELLGIGTTYSDVVDLVDSEANIDTVLNVPKAAAKEDIPLTKNEGLDSDKGEDFPDITLDDEDIDVAEDDDDIPDIDEDEDEDDIPDLESDEVEEELEEDVDEENEEEESDFSFDEDINDEDIYGSEEVSDKDEQEVPEEFIDDIIVRKFYEQDLNLEVTSEPFDALVMQDNDYVPFNEDRGDGWLDVQLNEMSREANTELERLHKENQWQLRERYFRLVTMACDRIRNDLDIHDPDTQYGQMYNDIARDREDALGGIDRRVQRRKEDIEAAWRSRLQEIGMEAARAAQHQYRERYSKQHDQEIFNIEAAERAAIEAEYQDSLHDMYERRRVEASSLLDLSITEVLKEISDMYMTAMAEEHERYKQLDSEMKDFVSRYRQDDISRSNALAEELRQNDKADKILAEQTAKLNDLSDDYRRKREELLDEIERLKRENETQLKDSDRKRQAEKKRWADERAELKAQYSELMQKYENLDNQKDAEYAARFDEMRDENDALLNRNDHLMEVHRRSNMISVFLLIAIAIAALAIGFIGGEYINTQQRTAEEQQAILDEYSNYEE